MRTLSKLFKNMPMDIITIIISFIKNKPLRLVIPKYITNKNENIQFVDQIMKNDWRYKIMQRIPLIEHKNNTSFVSMDITSRYMKRYAIIVFSSKDIHGITIKKSCMKYDNGIWQFIFDII